MTPETHEDALATEVQALIDSGEITWESVRAGLARAARAAGQWAGFPMPVEGTRMVIHPSYPFAENLGAIFCPAGGAHVCRNEDVREDVECRNSFRSFRDGKIVEIWREGKRFFFVHGSVQNTAPLLLNTLGAARAWDFDAELRALDTLARHVTEWQYQCYVMTGSFIESSKRSGVSYVFRRLRPTVALSGRTGEVRILCTLCLHPIGYYDGSWAGAMVPTDDVIAHLLLMRSDEHDYWRDAEQHPATDPASGL